MKYFYTILVILLLTITKRSFAQNEVITSEYCLTKGQEYMFSNTFDSAEYYFQKGIELAKSENNITRIFDLHFSINYGFYLQRKYKKIIEKSEETIDLYIVQLKEYPQYHSVFEVYIALGYSELEDYGNAYKHYLSALQFQGGIINENLNNIYSSLSVVSRKRGDLEAAIKYGLLTLPLYDKLNLSRKEQSDDYKGLGSAYMHLKEFNKSNHYFTKAWETTLNLDRKTKSKLQWSIENQKGLMYYHEKKYDSAIWLLSHPLSSRTPNFPGQFELRNQAANLSFVYRAWGKLDLAMRYALKELEYAKGLKKMTNREWAKTYDRFSEVYLAMQKYDSSLVYAQKSIANYLPLYDDEDIYSTPDLAFTNNEDALKISMHTKSKAFLGLALQSNSSKDQEMTVKSFRATVALLDKMRKIYEAQGSKKQLAKRTWPIFEDAISAMLQLYAETKDPKYQAEAFYFLEKSKAVLMQDELSDEAARNRLDLPDSILAKESELKVDIAYWENELLQAKKKKKTKKVEELQSKVFNKRNDLLNLTRKLEQDFPNYYKLKYEHEPLSLAELQSQLASEEGLVEFFMGDSSIFVFYIDQNTFQSHELKDTEGLVDQIIQLRKQLEPSRNPQESEKAFFAFQERSSLLYQNLLAPVLANSQAKHLYIIPDGELGYLPFEMLLTQPKVPEIPDYRELSFLIRKHEVSYGFSASLLFRHPSVKRNQGEGVLAFGPSYPKAITDSVRNTSLGKFRAEVGELIHNQKEAQMVSTVLNGQSFVGTAATEEQFKQSFSKYAILHLAMHALVDDENPTHSRLVFSFNEDGTEDDYLHVYELYNMKLNAQLAVLSACNTGFGQLQRGEGVMSIGRGFAYAGCPSIAMSHWQVDDEATAQLMEVFYQGLANGLSKSAALQQAQLHYLDHCDPHKASPFYWGSFVVMGDNSPVVSGSVWYYWLLGAVALLGVIAWLMKSRKQAS